MSAWNVSRLDELLAHGSAPAPAAPGAGWWDDDDEDDEDDQDMDIAAGSLGQQSQHSPWEYDSSPESSPVYIEHSLEPSPLDTPQSNDTDEFDRAHQEDPEGMLADLVDEMEAESPTDWLAAAAKVC